MKRIATISYAPIREIGVGQGMNSKVYLADEPQLGGVVAVKEVPKGNLGNSFEEYFQEAQAMFASIHPHVVPIQYACEMRDRICLVMPFFRNGSLADRISQSPISLFETLRVGQGILSGLSRIHGKGRIHFDIKPSNILFSDANVALVADFGQARRIDPNGVANVPPMYPFGLPPEFYLHGVGSVRSDIYQVGLTLYRAVNGDPTFREQIPTGQDELRQRTLDGKLPRRDKFLPHVPSKIRRAIRKALSVHAHCRFASAPDFADALGRVDLRLDWNLEIESDGSIQWTAQRDARPDLVVRLLPDNQRWRYEVYTQNAQSLRARGRSQWQRGLTRRQAYLSLKELFEVLV